MAERYSCQTRTSNSCSVDLTSLYFVRGIGSSGPYTNRGDTRFSNKIIPIIFHTKAEKTPRIQRC